MRITKLFQKTIFGIIVLFALIGISTSILSIYSVEEHLTKEYEANSAAIAKTIANASVDIILNRDLSTLQSFIDQFIEIQGISYIYITNEDGEYLAHTFVPGIPASVLARDPDEGVSVTRNVAGLGDFVEVASPILAGVAGSVHVGMDLSLVSLKIQQAIGQQIYLISGIFFVGIFAAFALVNIVSRPMDRLGDFAVKLAKDETNEHEEYYIPLLARNDELGELARLFAYFSRVVDKTKLGNVPGSESKGS